MLPKRHGGNDSAGQEAPLAIKSNKTLAGRAAGFVRAAESFRALNEPLSDAATRAGLRGCCSGSTPCPAPAPIEPKAKQLARGEGTPLDWPLLMDVSPPPEATVAPAPAPAHLGAPERRWTRPGSVPPGDARSSLPAPSAPPRETRKNPALDFWLKTET